MVVAIILLLVLVAVLGVIVYKASTSGHSDTSDEHLDDYAAGPRGVNRIQAGLRRRRAGARAAASDDDEDENERGGGRRGRAGRWNAAADSDDDEEEEAGGGEKPVTRRDAYEARRAAKDAERDAEEAALEEEIRRLAEERAKREAEEAEKWMHTFTVEASGEEALSREAGEAQLNEMVEYLRTRKAVALEELAAEFGLRTADAVAKVQALEAEGRITGIMDDRGKFIFVSSDEMTAVADFIKQQGRIQIAELAAKSGQFIDLEGKMSMNLLDGDDDGDIVLIEGSED